MPRRQGKHDIKNEAELCDLLTEHAKAIGWRVFPETGDFDLLLVATDKVATMNARVGDQIGIQAKMRPNIEVIAQSLPTTWGVKGPHFHAILVPASTKNLETVAGRCGIVVFEATRRSWDTYTGKLKRVRDAGSALLYLPPSVRCYYDEPVWHPDIEILVPAGVRSPRRVTPWKVNAVRMCLSILRRGFVTTADFHTEGISMAVWKQKGWIEPTGEKIGRSLKYRLVETANPPHLQYPEITETLKTDEDDSKRLTAGQRRALERKR